MVIKHKTKDVITETTKMEMAVTITTHNNIL